MVSCVQKHDAERFLAERAHLHSQKLEHSLRRINTLLAHALLTKAACKPKRRHQLNGLCRADAFDPSQLTCSASADAAKRAVAFEQALRNLDRAGFGDPTAQENR